MNMFEAMHKKPGGPALSSIHKNIKMWMVVKQLKKKCGITLKVSH